MAPAAGRAPGGPGREVARATRRIYDASMDVLEIPADVAIGAAEARAGELCARSEHALAVARELSLSILRGELRPSPPRDRHAPRSAALIAGRSPR
jgi:hypothetical protein